MDSNKGPVDKQPPVPKKLAREQKEARIRALYAGGNGYSMDEIVVIEKCSKKTVFFAIHRGRSSDKRRKKKVK